MGMKSRVTGIASIGIVVAFASSAFAQGAPGSAGSPAGSAGAGSAPSATAPNTGSAAGTAGSTTSSTSGSTNFTATNVSPTNPFGSIDVNAAGTTPESIRQWAQGRTASERAELQGRCGVITTSANSSRYPQQAVNFCRNFMTASNAQPGSSTGTTGSTTTR